MLKNIIYSLFATLLIAGCSNAGDDLQPSGEEQVVAVSMDVSRIGDEVGSSSLLLSSESSILRIMDANDNLIRRYSPANTVPATLQLTEGNYSATLSIGSQVAASMSLDDCYYWGEDSFTVSANSATVNLDAKIYNTAIKVNFDETIADNFEEGYIVKAIFEEGGVDEVSLTFTEDESGEMGYFLDYDNDYDSKKISWEFSGVRNRYSTDVEGVDRSIVMSGVIDSPAVGELNTLSFKYTPYYINTSIGLEVDVNVDVFDDNLDFALQPSIALVGYTEDNIAYDDDAELTFKITGAMASIAAVSVDGLTIPIVGGVGGTGSGEGYSYNITADKEVSITLSSSIFGDLTAGLNPITITATDSDNSTGRNEFGLFRSGWVNPLSWDTWAMSASFDIALAWNTQSTVKVQYSAKDSDVWVDAAGDIEYNSYGAIVSVKAEPSWSSAENSSGLTYYHSPTNGIVVNNSYKYRFVVGDVENASFSGEFTAIGETPDFVDGDFENDDLLCFGSDAGSSTTWASGNNTMASSLCAQTTFTGRSGYGVEMAGTETSIVSFLAAGNLMYGQFEKTDTYTGEVRFGQKFTWGSKPLKVRFDYAAYLGTVDYTKNASYVAKGSTDLGRIYVAVVDWTDRHATATSGGLSSSSTSGAWDPIDNNATTGKVIGYASLFVGGDDLIGVLSSSTKPSDLTTRELDIFYYDTETKPTGAITLVFSCSSSAYGHFFNGSSDSKMWIDEIELVY